MIQSGMGEGDPAEDTLIPAWGMMLPFVLVALKLWFPFVLRYGRFSAVVSLNLEEVSYFLLITLQAVL